MKAQAMSGKKKLKDHVRPIIFLTIQSTTGTARCRAPMELGGDGNGNLPGSAPHIPLATACGGFKRSNHDHPPKARGSVPSSLPQFYFFYSGGYL